MRVHPLKLFLIINALASLAAFTSENPGTRTIVAPLFAAAALACVGCLERQRQSRRSDPSSARHRARRQMVIRRMM